jgi:hypothetical protein
LWRPQWQCCLYGERVRLGMRTKHQIKAQGGKGRPTSGKADHHTCAEGDLDSAVAIGAATVSQLQSSGAAVDSTAAAAEQGTTAASGVLVLLVGLVGQGGPGDS